MKLKKTIVKEDSTCLGLYPNSKYLFEISTRGVGFVIFCEVHKTNEVIYSYFITSYGDTEDC
jgi:hypothetical protein